MDNEIGQNSSNLQDDDVALAKLLQEQERALYLLLQTGSGNQLEGEEMTDEELARRLQEEEDQAAYQAMAYGDLGAPGLLPEDEAEGQPAVQEQSSLPFSYEDMLALGDLAGKVTAGLKEDSLKCLPVVRFCQLRAASSTISVERCCICQLEFEDDDDTTPLPCRHCYHSDCVRQWLQQSKACPVCGKELEEDRVQSS